MSSLKKTADPGGPPDQTEVTVCQDIEALGKAAAHFIARLADECVTKKGRFTLALSGGTTPRILYKYLSQAPVRNEIPWGGVLLFWSDERCVPPDHPDSNFGMANEILLSKVPVPSENIFAFPVKMDNAKAAALAYENTICDCFDPNEDEIPSFDLMLLGIGADGHTASLFPETNALDEKEAWVAANYVKKLDLTRLTLTLPIINHAKRILFLAAGYEKALIIKALLSTDRRNSPYPAALVEPVSGRRYFFIDEDAAGELKR